MGRDNGLATLPDWGRRRADVLEQAQAGFSALGGNQVYMDIILGDRSEAPMRLVFMLFPQAPLAFANFHALCTHSVSGLGEAGHQLSYRRSKVHRVTKGRFFEAGDITIGDGRGGDSIYGAAGFEQERFGLSLSHDAAGLLCMAPSSAGDCQSRFRVLFGPVPALDGVSAVIGRLVSGADHLATIERLPVDAEDRPARPVTIVECGLIQGWATLPPPMPRAEASTARATLEDVGSAAASLRDAVANAVQAALGNGSSGEDGGVNVGDGGSDPTKDRGGKKRGAPPASGAAEAPATKRGPGGSMAPWMALPFADGLDSDDDDDDDEEEGAK